MNEEITSLSKEILTKEFKTSVSGYNKKDVDEFLDKILDFFEKLSKNVVDNEKYIDELTKNNLDLKMVIENLQQKNNVASLVSTPGNTKVNEIEKRLNVLSNQIEDIKRELTTI